MGTAIKFTQIQLIKESYTSKVGTTGSTTWVYEGPKALIFAKAYSLFVTGWQVNTVSNGEGGASNPIYTLTATYQADLSQNGGQTAGVTQPEPVWEVGGVAIQQSMFEIDRPIITSLSGDTREKIEKALKNPSLGLPLVSAIHVADLDNAINVYTMMQIGVEGKTINAKQIKRTVTVPNKFVSTWITNEGKVLSKDALISTYGVPYWIQNRLSDNSPRQVIINTIQFSVNILYAYYGYLEGETKYLDVGANMVQISTEWTYGRYPMPLFDTL